jgi:hypothetical protein
MELSDLVKILNGELELIPMKDRYKDMLLTDMIRLHPRHVKHMLSEFLHEKYTAEDLSRWAEFILIRDEYITPGDINDNDLMDYYEDMWYVLQRLSTPWFDGAITKERVKGYLAELMKYGNE